MVQRLSITPAPGVAQRPSAKHQSDACCSLSLRERVRVRGKYPVKRAKCGVSQGLLSNRSAGLRTGTTRAFPFLNRFRNQVFLRFTVPNPHEHGSFLTV